MIPRLLETALRESARYYPVITLTGPRQSGKTTLVRALWPDKRYVSLEDPDSLMFAQEDPRAFLDQSVLGGLVIDEAQRFPQLFSYLQGYADTSPPGTFVVTGSNNFLLMENIGQSLAGRTAVLSLLPFSGEELGANGIGQNWEENVLKGFYPRVHDSILPSTLFARDYIATYVERDVRLVKNIGDLNSFRGFLTLCAGRAGALLNLSALAADAGVAVNTVRSWISLLEAAYLVFRLPPWHVNVTSRVVKSPKLYWYDTSLPCYLLGIRNENDLRSHPLRGALFENLIIAERMKAATNRGNRPELSFWRNASGSEVDAIEHMEGSPLLWECKSGSTIGSDFFKHLSALGDRAHVPPKDRLLAYGGDASSVRSSARVVSWRDVLLGTWQTGGGLESL